MKIVTMHQPNYLPWIGFFSKVNQADFLVLTDVHQFTKHSVTNRNKVRTPEGYSYLTIPINKKFHNARICDVELPVDENWKFQHWRTIQHNYKKSGFFSLHIDFFEKLYQSDIKHLGKLNEEIILYLLKCFDIDVPVVKASDLFIDQNLEKTDLLIAILKNVGADIYLSGPSGKDYLNVNMFPQNHIGLKFFSFQHPVYEQRYHGFLPNMAAIDLLFNMGPEAKDLIGKSGSIRE